MMEPEAEAMGEALRNHVIVPTILSFLDNKTFLKCRRLNKFWDGEVLVLLHHPRKGFKGLYLNVVTFMDQGAFSFSLPPKSPLATRVLAGGFGECAPKDFLSFFTAGGGEVTEVIFLDQNECAFLDLGEVTWGEVLVQILKNNLAPKLSHLIIYFDPKGRVNNLSRNSQRFLQSLRNLRVLDLRCGSGKRLDGPFVPFIQALLKGAVNLERLFLRGTSFTEGPFHFQFPEGDFLKNLRVFELDLKSPNPKASSIPGVNYLLSEVAQRCGRLEKLSLPFAIDGPGKMLDVPRFPKLLSLTSWDPDCLDLEGDLLHFLREKMPLLKSLHFSDTWDDVDTFSRTFTPQSQSQGPNPNMHKGLTFLSIPAPSEPKVLDNLVKKFPSLKGLELIAGGIQRPSLAPDWVAEVAFVTATNRFPFPTTIYSWYGFSGLEEVDKKLKEKMGDDYKGTFRLSTLANCRGYYDILIPGKM